MRTKGIWRWPTLVILLILIFSIGESTIGASPAESDELPLQASEPTLDAIPTEARLPSPDDPTPPAKPPSQLAPPGSTLNDQTPTQLSPLALTDAGNVMEVFTNTWSYSTIGLVYVPGRDIVRYAHESQSSLPNPTIYDVDYPVAHTLLFSVALSAQNSGWPWELDNRTGAGYDFVAGTYFLPDYNGDLSYADDNIVEIDVDGNILNAWEMDDEVGSNDSSDGSEIDSIIDIAVVPGSPTRYFATASYDGGVVYEIALTKSGAWWTPNSWYTVMTYTGAISDTFTDNLGIDYDAQNERLYHSGWYTTTILVTDINMQPITQFTPTFDCPGTGGFNSGVTFIEGSDPPEIWVTDFANDQTTRCEAPAGEAPPAPGWEKRVAGQPYDPDAVFTRQLSQIISVTDVITALTPFTLTETWQPDRLNPVGLDIFPPVGQVITGVGSLSIVGLAGPPPVITITKWFRLEPCDWITTTLTETLEIEGAGPFAARPVTITKLAPNLQIDSVYDPDVLAGSVTSFTLTYTNTGGFENEVWISNSFPITAPFAHAEPFPDGVGPDGSWARWELGNLAQNEVGRIAVYVFISETVAASETINIWDGIFNHLDVLKDETGITFHVTEPPPVDWGKLVNGEPWRPGVSVTLQTSQTFAVEDVVSSTQPFILVEEWNPQHLRLVNVITSSGGSLHIGPGRLIWEVTTPSGSPMAINKEFHVQRCMWPDTLLWEELLVGGNPAGFRPVRVNKILPELWIDSSFDASVYSGDEAQFVLNYGNAGGRESAFMIRNRFPPEAAFVESDPHPTAGGPGDPIVEWEFPGGLDMGEEGSITVTVRIAESLPPSTTIGIWDGIFNHVDELMDETFIEYHVPPPTWVKWVDGEAWSPDLGVTVQTFDTITVTDVISTRSAAAIVEHWNPERLTLSDYITESTAPGIIISNTGFLSWEFPAGAPGTITLTKLFHVEPCTWTYTVLWEELWVEGIEWNRRPLHIDKITSELWIESAYEPDIFAGDEVSFILTYGNYGGMESRAWISNTFPAEAPFVQSDPAPTEEDANGRWALWDVGALATDEGGSITVTVAITETLPPNTMVYVYDYIYDHADVEHDRTDIVFKRGPSVYLPLVLKDYGSP